LHRKKARVCSRDAETQDRRDRSLSQKLPGWNNLLLPKDDWESQIVSELAPRADEIVATKMTDSALTAPISG
jgi:nicotinamidase-related amidase